MYILDLPTLVYNAYSKTEMFLVFINSHDKFCQIYKSTHTKKSLKSVIFLLVEIGIPSFNNAEISLLCYLPVEQVQSICAILRLFSCI